MRDKNGDKSEAAPKTVQFEDEKRDRSHSEVELLSQPTVPVTDNTDFLQVTEKQGFDFMKPCVNKKVEFDILENDSFSEIIENLPQPRFESRKNRNPLKTLSTVSDLGSSSKIQE